MSIKTSAGRPREEWKHAANIFRRAISMKTTTENTKASNAEPEFKKLKTAIEEGSCGGEGIRFFVQKNCLAGLSPPNAHTRHAYSTHMTQESVKKTSEVLEAI